MTWADVAWGFHHGYLARQDVIDMACDRLVAGDEDPITLRIASLFKSDSHEVGELIDQHPAAATANEEASKAKWLYLLLAWIFENRDQLRESWKEVDTVYSDFDYPECVAPFVPWMPPADGYDPGVHTREENYQRMLDLWREFIERKRSIYLAG